MLNGEQPYQKISEEHKAGVMYAVVVEGVTPPTEPSQGPDGTSYAVAWNVAELCWSSEPSSRISIKTAMELLPVLNQNSTDLQRIITDQDLGNMTLIPSGFRSNIYTLKHSALGLIALKQVRDEGTEANLPEVRRVSPFLF